MVWFLCTPFFVGTICASWLCVCSHAHSSPCVLLSHTCPQRRSRWLPCLPTPSVSCQRKTWRSIARTWRDGNWASAVWHTHTNIQTHTQWFVNWWKFKGVWTWKHGALPHRHKQRHVLYSKPKTCLPLSAANNPLWKVINNKILIRIKTHWINNLSVVSSRSLLVLNPFSV